MNYLIIVAFILGTGFPSSKFSRCYVPATPEAFEKAKVVFVGKVISVEDPTLPPKELQPQIIDLVRPIKVRFNVERVYRGKDVSEIEVETKTGGLEFGFEFKVGERYLVYSQESKTKEGDLIVESCGRTRLISDATEDLKFLEATKKTNEIAKADPLQSLFVRASRLTRAWSGLAMSVPLG